MRTALSLLAASALVVSLAACSGGTTGATDCDATPSGSVSNAVKVSGDFGTKPDVTINFPTAAPATERTVVIAGDGDLAVTGDTVNVEYALYNGETGTELAATEYAADSTVEFPIDESQFLTGIVKTLNCSTVGSRVVGVIPAADSFGDAGNDQLGVAAGEDIVFVVDIVSIAPPTAPVLPKADGVEQPATPGFPTVVLDDTGRPTVTIPDTAPPADLQLAVLKLGSGAVVAEGDDVTVHYQGTNWNTGVLFDESWGGDPASFNTAEVIAGFTSALVGQTVGSQVIVIIPPAEGYGEAGSPPDIGGTDTLVFVIDILGIG